MKERLNDARERVLGPAFAKADQLVEGGAERSLEVIESFCGKDEPGDLGRERMLMDHLGQLVDLLFRQRL